MPFDGTEFNILGPPETGCAYITGPVARCGLEQKPSSPYCPAHHALCHVVCGSRAEQVRIAEIDAAAEFIGQRVIWRSLRAPPRRFMRALDALQRIAETRSFG